MLLPSSSALLFLLALQQLEIAAENAAATAGTPPLEERKHGLIELDASNIDQALQEGPIFVKFFAPWCKHCKDMAKDFHSLSKEQLADGIRVGRVDGTKNQALGKRFGIPGFPSLLLFTEQGKEMRSYAGDRSLQSMLAFVNGGWKTTPLHDPTKSRRKKSMGEEMHSLPWTVKAVGLLFIIGLPLSILAACYDVYVENRRKEQRRAERKAEAGKMD
eukprot:TRINITY_DN12343_c0_g1_i1.p1 TRINITY_DN12343_c0_g1~~TRINITY_DN12343_c0_g1_i1.p1  ORF type:complete len:224 (+),score=57.38 TRINITY_DN12343_c0_g1_i1:24-674(+)